MRILIVDDHVLFAEALRLHLADHGMDVLPPARTGKEALAAATRDRPDVVLVDLGLPDMSGTSAGRLLLQELPDATLVAVTVLDGHGSPPEVLKAGFRGVLSKHTPLDDFVRSLESIVAGEAVGFPSGPSRRPLRTAGDPDAELLSRHLTARELEVLALLVEGGSNAFIAARLSVSPNTVRTHVQSILTKLQVRSRLEAATFAVRHGLTRARRRSG